VLKSPNNPIAKSSNGSNDRNFDVHKSWEFRDLHQLASGRGFGLEILAVHRIDAAKKVNVFDKNGGFEHFFEAAASGFDDGAHILEHAVRLGFDVVQHELARGGINGDLARHKQHSIERNCLIVRPNGQWGSGGVDELFHAFNGFVCSQKGHQGRAIGREKPK
jgi:hypothetical protein